MKIAAVCTAYHEADILPWTIEHLLTQGVDEILIEMPFPILESDVPEIDDPRVKWLIEAELFHDQPRIIKSLGDQSEADWIIPFDADEFVYAPDPMETIRDVLEAIPPEFTSITMPSYKHRNWWWREVGPPSMPKVAYRYTSDVSVGPGNHTLTGLPPDAIRVDNALMIREIQYRSFEHFTRKVEERSRTIDPSFGPEMGHHIRQHAGKSQVELEAAWDEMNRVPIVWDPIPSPITPPLHLAPNYEHYEMPELLELMKAEPNDIAGHLERLREIVYETGTDRVVECGVCTGMSTIAFLSTGVPVESCDVGNVRVRTEVVMAPNWSLHIGSDLDWSPEPCKVIFIDTTHTYRQTAEELKRYWPLVLPGGCLIMHDTVSYAEEMRAIRHWMHTVSDIRSTEFYEHDNGLGVFWKDV
jgi:Methyltransferase domain